MRRAAKTDANQAELVAALRALGCSVQPLHGVGAGVPDLLVGLRGVCCPVEVKANGGKYTPRQIEWKEQWRGPVETIRDLIDCEILARRLRMWADKMEVSE